MADSSAGSFADRVARQLGLDAAGVAGSGPDGAATLTDVLREAGRRPPAAARPPPPRTVFPGGADAGAGAGADSDGEAGEGTLRMEVTCDARAVRETCDALSAVAAEPPEAVEILERLCGAARRDFPGLSEAAFVLRPSDAPETVLPPASAAAGGGDRPASAAAGGGDRPAGAVVAIILQSESIRFGLELDIGAKEEGAAFLDRLRWLCLDPRRALL